MTPDEVLLAGVAGDLPVYSYFTREEILDDAPMSSHFSFGEHLAIPPYVLLAIETNGCARIVQANDRNGMERRFFMIKRTRDQLRVFVPDADIFVERLVAQRHAKDEIASNADARGNARPGKGITKRQAIFSFGSLVKIDLKSALEDGKKWVEAARVSKGTPGGKHPSLWCPVLLSVCLYEKHRVSKSQLNKVFREHAFLGPWRDEWRETSEDL